MRGKIRNYREPEDELIKYLDDILSGLRYQDGHYDLVKLHDKEYQDKLQ